MASFSDLFKLGKEILKTETFVLHEAETRGLDEGGLDFLTRCLPDVESSILTLRHTSVNCCLCRTHTSPDPLLESKFKHSHSAVEESESVSIAPSFLFVLCLSGDFFIVGILAAHAGRPMLLLLQGGNAS